MCHERTDLNRQSTGRTASCRVLVLLFCGINGATAASIPKDAASFELTEISAFAVPDPVKGAFMLGVYAECRAEPEANASGSIGSTDAALSLTESLKGQGVSRSSSFRLPVGDYSPLLLNVTYGMLNCSILRNSHADGLPGGRSQQGPPIYAIQIREDRPFVLDFSDKPQVLFALPGKDHRVKRGDKLGVKAVLIDPALDIMFRRIQQIRQLDPTVTVKRADGETVAEGVMPFG